jgi:RimJ/RimL family protein N-acetyltransferase
VSQPTRSVSGTPGTPGTAANEDTADLQLEARLAALIAEREAGAPDVPPPCAAEPVPRAASQELLDSLPQWPAVRTAVGMLQLVPVRLERDLRLITAWMNDPAVTAFWELAGPEETTARHLRAQMEGDGRSVPCLGVLDGVPMSYWEFYRADLDPIARYCEARPHDTGLHLLIGGVPDRGRGVGSALLRAAADLVLDQRPRCMRVLAEPDLRNIPSIAAFLNAGFRLHAEVDLPGKRAALMVRERRLRDVL